MLTPQEIQDQKFEKAVFGGYDMGQIDQFLDVVLNDYSSLYKENAALKAKMRVLVDKLEEYRAVDEDLRKTLYNAQMSAKDTVSRAEAEAERILRDARTAASRQAVDIQDATEEARRQLEAAKKANAAYAVRIRKAMEQGIRQMEQVLEMSEDAGAAEARPAQEVPASPLTPAADETQIFRAAPAQEEPAAPAADETQVFTAVNRQAEEAIEALDEPATPAEDDPFAPDPKSDTARIYGDSPYTPKPRFDFDDLRFGKNFEEDEDDK